MGEKFISEKELSEWLNMKLSTIGRLRREKNIPHIRVGKLIRYPVSEIEDWLEQYHIDKTKG